MSVPATDEELMQKLGAGSLEAFEALYTRYRRRRYTFLVRCVHNEALAEDLYQETFLRVLRAAPRWRPQARFSTWLYRVALNLCLDVRRRELFPVADPAPAETLADLRPGPQESVQSAELSLDLERALARLSIEHRAVLLLRYGQGLSEREVAEIVGCPVGTVKSRLHHALRHLRRELGAQQGSVAEPDTESSEHVG